MVSRCIPACGRDGWTHGATDQLVGRACVVLNCVWNELLRPFPLITGLLACQARPGRCVSVRLVETVDGLPCSWFQLVLFSQGQCWFHLCKVFSVPALPRAPGQNAQELQHSAPVTPAWPVLLPRACALSCKMRALPPGPQSPEDQVR